MTEEHSSKAHGPPARLALVARISAFLVVCAMTISSAQGVSPARQVFDAALELLNRYYHGYAALDVSGLRAEFAPKLEAACTSAPICGFEIGASVVDEMVSSLEDPHTYALDAAQTLEFERSYLGEPSGLLQLGANIAPVAGSISRLVLRRAYEGGPAFEAGLRRGDQIRAFNTYSVASFKSPGAALFALTTAIRSGQAVRLEIQRAHRTRFSSTITPRRLPPPAPELELRSDGVAVISIFQFEDGGRMVEVVHDQVRRAQQANARAIILDLRDSRGGLLSAMLRTLGAFVDHADLTMEAAVNQFQAHAELDAGSLRFLGTGSIDEIAVAQNPALWSGPLIVLTSARTASAPEYLAFMLQRAGRARVVGEPTAGLLSTGNGFFELPGGSSLSVTVARSIDAEGVRFPDRVMPDTIVRYNPLALSFGYDVALEYSLARLR